MPKRASRTPVIPSGAHCKFIRNEGEWRGVEGPRRCFVARHSIKAFSREFPDPVWTVPTFSRSFDSPSSRAAGLGLAQDDRGRGSRPLRVPTSLKQVVFLSLGRPYHQQRLTS